MCVFVFITSTFEFLPSKGRISRQGSGQRLLRHNWIAQLERALHRHDRQPVALMEADQVTDTGEGFVFGANLQQ